MADAAIAAFTRRFLAADEPPPVRKAASIRE